MFDSFVAGLVIGLLVAATLLLFIGPPQENALRAQQRADTRYVEGVIYGARMATLKCYPTYTGKR